MKGDERALTTLKKKCPLFMNEVSVRIPFKPNFACTGIVRGRHWRVHNIGKVKTWLLENDIQEFAGPLSWLWCSSTMGIGGVLVNNVFYYAQEYFAILGSIPSQYDDVWYWSFPEFFVAIDDWLIPRVSNPVADMIVTNSCVSTCVDIFQLDGHEETKEVHVHRTEFSCGGVMTPEMFQSMCYHDDDVGVSVQHHYMPGLPGTDLVPKFEEWKPCVEGLSCPWKNVNVGCPRNEVSRRVFLLKRMFHVVGYVLSHLLPRELIDMVLTWNIDAYNWFDFRLFYDFIPATLLFVQQEKEESLWHVSCLEDHEWSSTLVSSALESI
jgi:hypothetical protein